MDEERQKSKFENRFLLDLGERFRVCVCGHTVCYIVAEKPLKDCTHHFSSGRLNYKVAGEWPGGSMAFLTHTGTQIFITISRYKQVMCLILNLGLCNFDFGFSCRSAKS